MGIGAVGGVIRNADGHRVGTHDLGEGGWKDRFAFDVTSQLQKGENEIAVRVIDRIGPGGVWKPVKIFIAK